MSTKPQELNKIIADLRQIIVGKVAMPTDQIEQITLFLFLKQLSQKHDDLVRLHSKEGLIFVGEWKRYHFDVLTRHSGDELVKECREAVESLYKNPNIDATVRKVFERSYLKILEPKVLSSFLQYLNDKFSNDLDLGDFYESLLPILGTQNELGQFRTPRHIIDFIVRVIDPIISEKIADPACGTAGFLVSAFNYLKKKYTDETGRLKLNPEQIKALYNETIFGWDMEPLMVKFSLANLYLHGLKIPQVGENDTLLNENLWQHTFDVIIANPPFITPKGGARRHSRFAITSNKTEVLFCEYIVHHLNINGRMGIIVPEGIIFDASKGHQAIRKLFLDNGLWCVVSLPAQIFQPYSGVKTSIIFLDKTLTSEQILFYGIENHGFSLNTNPAPIDKNDLPNAVEMIKKFHEDLQSGKQTIIDEKKYYTIPRQKVLESGTISFACGNYREIVDQRHNKYPVVKLGDVIETLVPPQKIQKSHYLISGKYPIIDQSQTEIAGWTNEESTLFKIDKPILVFGDHTCIIKYVDHFFAQGADGIKVLKISVNLLPKFIYFFLKAQPIQTDGYKRHFAKLKSIKIPLPPLEIQEQIVAELDGYQKIIDGARAVVGNWKPSFEVDSKWEIKKLGEVCVKITDGTHKTPKYTNEGVPFLRVTDITESNESKKYLSKEEHKELIKRCKPEKGDVLYTKNGTIGIAKMIDWDYEFSIFVSLALLKPKKDMLEGKYLEHFLNSELALSQAKAHSKAGTITNLHLIEIKQFNVPLPSLEIQQQIVTKIEEEQNIIDANKKLITIYEQKIKDVIAKLWSE